MSMAQKLNSLRLQELKQLCTEEGLDANGGKKALIERIVQHQKAITGNAETPEPDVAPEPTTPKSRPKAQAGSGARGRGRGSGRSARGRGSEKSTPTPTSGRGRRGLLVLGSKDGSDASSPTRSKQKVHCVQCKSDVAVAQEAYRDNGAGFICFECRLRVMDPFHPVEPKGILYSAPVKKDSLDFSVDMSNLKQWRRDGLRLEVRMLRVDHAKVCHVWPRTMTFSANNKSVFEVQPPEEGHKRRDIPQEVSSCFSQGLNLAYVKLTDPHPETLFFSLVLTAERSVADLAASVERSSLSKAQARVQELLAKSQGQSGSAEDIVCLSTNKLKLVCPITMDKVTEPVRGEQCQHLQCFTLEAYLSSNLKMSAFNNRWMCPVCSLIVRPTDLRVDGYVQSILTSTSEETEEVVILPNGQWRLCGDSSPEQGAPMAQEATAASIQETVDLEDVVDSEDEVLSKPTATKQAEVDSEDEVLSLLTQPEPSKPPPAKQAVVGKKRGPPIASPARQSGGSDKRRCLERTSEVDANKPKAVLAFRKSGGKAKGASSPKPRLKVTTNAVEKFSFSTTTSLPTSEVLCLD